MKIFGKNLSLVDGDKAFEKSLDWALELTSGNAALNGDDVPEDLREPLDKTIFTRSGKPYAGQTLVQDRFMVGATALNPFFWLVGLFIWNITIAALGMGLFVGVLPAASASTAQSVTMKDFGIIFGSCGLIFFFPVLIGWLISCITQGTLVNPFGMKQGSDARLFKMFLVWCLGTASSFLIGGVANFGLIGLLVPYFFFMSPFWLMKLHNEKWNIERARTLSAQLANHRSDAGEARVDSYHNNNKIKQIYNGKKDTTLFVPVGEATGMMRALGRKNAPVRGKVMGLTLNDKKRHLSVWGDSGGGKSFTLRNIGYYICKSEFGFLLVDGKNTLVKEFGVKSEGGLLDEIISIERSPNLNILLGLPPQMVASVILTVSSPEDSKKDIWDSAAGLGCFYASSIQELLVEMKNPAKVNPDVLEHFNGEWIGVSNHAGYYDESFLTFKRIGVEMLTPPEKGEHELIEALMCHSQYKETTLDKKGEAVLTNRAVHIDNCIHYVKTKQREGSDRINSSIEFTVDSWNSLMITSEKILGWAASTHSDVDVTECLRRTVFNPTTGKKEGKKIGIHIDPSLGDVSKLVQRFLITKVLIDVTARANINGGWESQEDQVQCYFMCDEAQDVLTSYMIDKAAVTRSLGFSYIIATQTEDSLIEKLGEPVIDVFKNHFRSCIWGPTNNKRTVETIIYRCGKTHIINSGFKTGAPIDFDHTEKAFLESPEFDRTHPDYEYMTKLGSRSAIGNMFHHFGNKQSQAHYTKQVGVIASQYQGNLDIATYHRESDKPLDVYNYEIAARHNNIGMAICQLSRAGYERIDLCKMYGRDENFNLIK
ncbi:TPA: hypothetical protein MYP09_001458 [Citrobacter farmeri]|nr:hypothetical protein [Citrobacter farmeri]